MIKDYVFTSESVTEGHPDKMSDQVSDAVLDAILAEDPHARVACETVFKTGLAMIAAGSLSTIKANPGGRIEIMKAPKNALMIHARQCTKTFAG